MAKLIENESPTRHHSSSVSSQKQYDPVIFDILRVSVDELASQITLNDLEVFKRITVKELLSCSWTNKKSKWEDAPNIVQFTQNFNSTSYLTCREVLGGHTAEHRSHLIAYFVRLSKKLYSLNNLHATWAIISALSTQSIFRLSHTWSKVAKSDRQQMQKFADLFSSKDNFEQLRKYMDSTTMPCIPHLGLYLTDLVFMNDILQKSKHDRIRVQESIDKLLRSLCSFQDSCYDLIYYPHINSFLQDAELPIQMIGPAEKLFYQLSLRLEPEQQVEKKNGKRNEDDSSRRSSLPLQAIRSLTTSAARFSPSIHLRSPRRKKSLIDIMSPGIGGTFTRLKNSTLADDYCNGLDNASYTSSPTEPSPQKSSSKWYDTLENLDDNEDSTSSSSPKFSTFRFADLTRRLRSLDIHDAAWTSALTQKLTPRSANGTPRLKKRATFSATPELLRRRAKTPIPAEQNALLVGDEAGEVEAAGVFTRTQLAGSGHKSKLIRNHQTCFLELRGRSLFEYERRLVPFVVYAQRDHFQLKPKRVLSLGDGEWTVRRPLQRFGFCVLNEASGREFEYVCQSATQATHWMSLIKEAIEGQDLMVNVQGSNGGNMEATRL